MKSRTKKSLFGLLVGTGLLLFIVGIFFIGRKEDLYVPTIHVYTIFSDINGLREGDFVRFSGSKAGVVEKITFLNDSMIRVDMKIEQSMQPYIMDDDLVYISTEGLVGNKLINITASRHSRTVIADGGSLEAVNPFNTQEIIENLLATNANATVISSNLAQLSTRLNGKDGIVPSLMTDSTITTDFKDILANVKATSIQMSAMSARLDQITATLDLTQGLAGSLMYDTVLVNDLSVTMDNLRESSNRADSVMLKLSNSMENNQSSSFGLLMNDSTVTQSLRQTIFNLQESTAKLDTNMEALQHSILLRRYFRKKEKAQ